VAIGSAVYVEQPRWRGGRNEGNYLADILGRVKASRKDKALITFTNYKGESVTNKYADVMTVWANKFGAGDVQKDKHVTDAQLKDYFTSGEYFVTFFPNKPKEDDGF
jgi:hypothetical protein